MLAVQEKTQTQPNPRRQAHVLGYAVDLEPLNVCIDECIHAIKNGESRHVVTLNPEMMIYAQQQNDPGYHRILQQAHWRIPDGVGIIWALQRQGIHDVSRMPGIEFSEALIRRAAQDNIPIALIGGSEEVNQEAVDSLKNKRPDLKIAYHHHGFFSPQEETDIVEACQASGAQIVFLALGFPRQEFWIKHHQKSFPQATLMLGVGGSFDIWSGSKKRAPKFFRDLNLEWAYRIGSEPWRLQRVYKTLPEYLVKAVLLNHNRPE